MALKDLVAQRGSLAEDAIEEIVASYVRYDPDDRAIAFTPDAAKLPNRAKVLVYLVALQGWPFVTDEAVPVDAKPAEIGDHVGIQGGTLRPILKELKDRHVIAERSGRYFVRPVTLAAIKAELGTEQKGTNPRPRRGRKRGAPSAPVTAAEPPERGARQEGRRGRTLRPGGLSAQFDRWIDLGFFDQPRTLSDVQKRFHKEGSILPKTSVPKYLLQAIRSGRLHREEREINKRTVWVYQRESDKR